jgi:nitric-oxide synthase
MHELVGVKRGDVETELPDTPVGLGRRAARHRAATPGEAAACPHASRPALPSGFIEDPVPVPSRTPEQVFAEAAEFLELCYGESRAPKQLPARLAAVRREIADTGTYLHTTAELRFGARAAWRNSNRCIGRLYWNNLTIRDRREITDPAEIAAECFQHLRDATNDGRIRPVITVFAPDAPGAPGPRIWNEQLIRYAGYRKPDNGTHGDPRNIGITSLLGHLGWPGGIGSPFDVLPLLVSPAGGGAPSWFTPPPGTVMEVPITHPELEWFAELELRWHAVPAISNMCLEIGGICYPAAPFNGWYMGAEIGARNLADGDRYNLLPTVASLLGMDISDERSLWKDRALVELNRAVLHSFDAAGVTITDHHTESRRFLAHVAREERAGRTVGADWSWIVPPISGGVTPVFHRYYDTVELRPRYVHHPEAAARAEGRLV